MCKPNGYFAVTDPDAFTDLWAFCVLRLVARHNNSGPDELDILFDQPLGWWDAEWPGSHGAAGCFRNDGPVNDTYFEVCGVFTQHPLFPYHLAAYDLHVYGPYA